MTVSLVPVGPGVDASISATLQSLLDAVQQLQQPDGPSVLPKIATAALLLSQAPAASYPDCAIQVVDKHCIALSTLVSGTWTWLRADGSSL